MPQPTLTLPAANGDPAVEPQRHASLRARLGRRMKGKLRGTPMSAFQGEGPQGRFVLVRDRAGGCPPVLLLSNSEHEGVPQHDLLAALAITPEAQLVQGSWRRRARTVSFCADNDVLAIKELHDALATHGANYGVLLLLAHAA